MRVSRLRQDPILGIGLGSFQYCGQVVSYGRWSHMAVRLYFQVLMVKTRTRGRLPYKRDWDDRLGVQIAEFDLTRAVGDG